MTETAVKLYEGNSETYDRFVSLFRYQQGIESFFSRWKPLDSAERILDAGCGTGLVTVALVDAMEKRDLTYDEIHGFDITPTMLEKFRERVEKRDIPDVTARWADVRDLETLPPSWQDYDLIVLASMLEYVREDELALALSGLRSRLSSDGRLLFFVTRRNPLMRVLIGWFWKANRYSRRDLRRAVREAGFSDVSFHRFPCSYAWFNLWGHIVEVVP